MEIRQALQHVSTWGEAGGRGWEGEENSRETAPADV